MPRLRVVRSLARRRHARARLRRRAGFSLVETVLAAFVFALAIMGSLTALQRGFIAVDTARSYTYASQVMESELERLRLFNWTQMQALEDAGDQIVTATAVPGSTAASFSCNRAIRDLKSDMKEIVLTATWSGHDGRSHSAKLITHYSKLGLYDYFYTAH